MKSFVSLSLTLVIFLFSSNVNAGCGEPHDSKKGAKTEKFEKTRTPRRRGKPTKKEVECHICGKVFSMNANLVYGEYVRCNRCTGR